jgi:hypothetical protein
MLNKARNIANSRARRTQGQALWTRGSVSAKDPRQTSLAWLIGNMRSRKFIRTAIIILLTAELGASVAIAEDQPIKAGKWQFTLEIPEVASLPPGMKPPPGAQMGPRGLSHSRTACITSDDALPPVARGPSQQGDAKAPCHVEQVEVNGGTVTWSTTCTTPQMTLHAEGVVHYHGDTLDGEFNLHATLGGQPPIEISRPLTGLYLGPCDAK